MHFQVGESRTFLELESLTAGRAQRDLRVGPLVLGGPSAPTPSAHWGRAHAGTITFLLPRRSCCQCAGHRRAGVCVRRQVQTLPECPFAQLGVLPVGLHHEMAAVAPLPSAVGGHTSHPPQQGFAQDFGRGPQHMSTSQPPVPVTLFGEKGLRRCDPVKGAKGEHPRREKRLESLGKRVSSCK